MAFAMVSAIAPMSAFADTQVKQDSSNHSGDMIATYDVKAKYTVTIPAGVTLDSKNSVTANFKASEVMLESGQKIKVTLTDASNTASGSTTFSAKTEKGDSTATYTISKGETAVAVGDTVAEFTENGEQSLTFSKAEGATYAGKHTETLTFGIAVEQATPATVLSGALVDGAAIKVNFKWRGLERGDYVQGVYNASSGTFTVTKGGDYWGRDDRAVYKVEKSGDNIIIGAGYYGYDEEGMVWTFDTTNDTFTYTQGGLASSRPNNYGIISVTLNGTDITSQLTKN